MIRKVLAVCKDSYHCTRIERLVYRYWPWVHCLLEYQVYVVFTAEFRWSVFTCYSIYLLVNKYTNSDKHILSWSLKGIKFNQMKFILIKMQLKISIVFKIFEKHHNFSLILKPKNWFLLTKIFIKIKLLC